MIQTPRLRAKSSSAFCSSDVIVQPVGLPGELTKIARVRSSTASNTFCRSSFQLPVGLAVERHVLRHAAHQLRGRGDVRPDRRDDHDVVAGIEQKLAAQQDRLHAAGRHRDAVGRAFDAVDPLGVGRQRRAAARECRAATCKRSRRPAGPWPAASRTKSGVTRSPSPNHSGTTSGSPNTVIATSVMGVSERPPMGPLSDAPRPESFRRELSDMASDVPHRRPLRQPAACPTIVGGETKPDLSLSNRQNMIRSRPMKHRALVLSIVDDAGRLRDRAGQEHRSRPGRHGPRPGALDHGPARHRLPCAGQGVRLLLAAQGFLEPRAVVGLGPLLRLLRRRARSHRSARSMRHRLDDSALGARYLASRRENGRRQAWTDAAGVACRAL